MMSNAGESNVFSFGDALFLYIEREGQPLNIAAVSVFESEIKRADCMAFIESKLPMIPRYRQRVVFPPFDLALPRWEFDPNFDIKNHVQQVTLKHGTEQEFKALAGKIMSTRLDRERPLWDFTLARMQGGRTGIVIRIHHCMADGVAGVGVINVIMDTAPRPIRRRKLRPEPIKSQKDPIALFVSGLAESYVSLVSRAAALESGLLSLAREVVANPGETIRQLSELAAPAERLPFNLICRGPQKFAWNAIPLADIKAVKDKWGGTVNDVVLTTVTMAFGRYAEQRGVELKGHSLRIVVPVNVRGDGSAMELGNQVSLMPVPIPLDIRDPQRLLAEVRKRVELLKRTHAPEFVGLLGTVMATLPTAVSANISSVASQLPLSLCNVICTNVPGPQMPLYLMGHKMLTWYPWVPIGGLQGINCAILTYNGTAYFGFTGDVHAAPDLERLEKFVDQSFAELLAGATAGAKPQKYARPHAKIPFSRTALRSRRQKSPSTKVVPLPSASGPL